MFTVITEGFLLWRDARKDDNDDVDNNNTDNKLRQLQTTIATTILTGPSESTFSLMKDSREFNSVCSRFGSEAKATGFGIVRHSAFFGGGVGFCQYHVKKTSLRICEHKRREISRVLLRIHPGLNK